MNLRTRILLPVAALLLSLLLGCAAAPLSPEEAQTIALNHAGLSSGDVRELQVEYDKDDGVPVYEVEFESGNREYSYEIHAETGKIRSHEIDD